MAGRNIFNKITFIHCSAFVGLFKNFNVMAEGIWPSQLVQNNADPKGKWY